MKEVRSTTKTYEDVYIPPQASFSNDTLQKQRFKRISHPYPN